MRFAAVTIRSFTLGAACGPRAMSGLTALALSPGNAECAPCRPALLRAMRSGPGKLILAAAAVGEVVADKSPRLPSRIDPGPLSGRIAIGGVSGFLLTRTLEDKQAVSTSVIGAAVGSAGALVGAFAGYHARRAITRMTRLPDPPVALIEDGIAYGIAVAVTRKITP